MSIYIKVCPTASSLFSTVAHPGDLYEGLKTAQSCAVPEECKHTNHIGILLKHKSWFSVYRVEPEILYF